MNALQRRELRVRLRAARRSADLTVYDVAMRLGWPLINVLMIEQGITPVDSADIVTLFDLYDTSEPMS